MRLLCYYSYYLDSCLIFHYHPESNVLTSKGVPMEVIAGMFYPKQGQAYPEAKQ
jgi:hypothetical protein